MSQINWSRVVTGGAVWFVSYNLLTGLAWLAFLHRWGLPSFHPLLGAPQTPSTGRILGVLLLTLAMGIFAMWLYAAIRPRYGARPITSAYAAVGLWLVWGLFPSFDSFTSLIAGSLLLELVCKLGVLIAATAAGASLYNETAV